MAGPVRVRTSVLACERGTQCPELVADATSDTRPKVVVARGDAEGDLPRWDALLRKRQAIERHEASLQEARRRLRDPYLLSHEVDFFATAEAEAKEKVRLALDEFWALNVKRTSETRKPWGPPLVPAELRPSGASRRLRESCWDPDRLRADSPLRPSRLTSRRP